MLMGAGIDLGARPLLSVVWPVIKEFGRIAVDDVPGGPGEGDDAMLFETGLFDWHDGKGERHQIIVVRQFTLYDADEYDHMEQLTVELFDEPLRELAAARSAPMWSMEFRALDEFYGAVEASSAYRVCADRRPVEVQLYQSVV
jgi:hypothetical protein